MRLQTKVTPIKTSDLLKWEINVSNSVSVVSQFKDNVEEVQGQTLASQKGQAS